ncbi:MAG TPA: geranylgeranyl reductase family protein [Vicinamibacterales bacterium]|nr:geranylgeranyl reductase family protein [Vicinamibacterales bacterium]
MRDVVVIGAGPAGAITAADLAASGHDVVLLEEHETVGEPVHCTGLIGLEAFAEFGLPASIRLGASGEARFWGAAGESVLVRSGRVHAAVIDRAGLDRWLAGRAVAAGAELRVGARVEQIAAGDRSVQVTIRGAAEVIEARAAVLACGANYRFHRQLGFGRPSVYLQSAQIEAPFPEVPEIQVRFGREVAPGGFAWLVPFDRAGISHARIGLMSEDRAADHFNAFVGQLVAEVGVPASTLPPPRLKVLPLGPVPRTFADRVLAVGDAAGLVKPTTGGGIYYGILSGRLAAGVLREGLGRNRLTASFLRRYERAWRRMLGSEIRAGLRFRRLAARLDDEAIDALIDLARVNGIVPLVEAHASFNWHGRTAMALLAHPSFRRVVFRSWARAR